MKTIKPTIAAAEVVLIFPAALFMTSLFVRELQPLQYEPAHTAQRIVDWYAARVHMGLWVLLIALPLTVLATGCATLLRAWRGNAELRQTARQTIAAIRAHLATLLVAAATLAAGGILAIVALHMLTD
jgi:cytochrome b561